MALLQTNYVKRNSAIHSLNPLVKFTWMAGVISVFLLSPNMLTLIILDLIIIIAAFISKISRVYLRGLLFMIGPIFFFSLIIHGLFNPLGGQVGIGLSLEGLNYGLFYGFKITSLISIFYLFILTTYPGDMVASLKTIKMPYKLGYLMNSTLQIIPLMLRESETIIDAQRARGLETKGKLLQRFKAYIPLIGPLILGSVTKVFERTIALEVRGFSLKGAKTSFNVIKFKRSDKIIAAISIGLTILYITLRVIGWQL